MSRPIRVLVVDDSEVERYLLRRILEGGGYRVVEAATAAEALDRVDDDIDAVVMDVALPDLDGFEAVRRLRRLPAGRSLPVLHVSAVHRTAPERVSGLDAGADGFLVRPVEPSVLLAHLRALVRARRAERRLTRANERWRGTFDAIADGIAVVDADGLVVAANRALGAFLDEDPAALAGRPIEAVLGVLVGGAVPSAALDPVPGTALLRHGDRAFRVHVAGFPSGSGDRVWTVREVTEALRAAEELRRSEEQFRDLASAIRQVYWLADALGRVLYAGPGFAALWGVEPEAFDAEALAARVAADDREAAVRVLCSDEAEDGEFLVRLAGGPEPRWIRVHRARRRDPRGAGTIAFVAEDVTEVQRREAELRAAREQFWEAQKLEAVARLAGGVAHDFNNLLTVIGATAELMAERLGESADPAVLSDAREIREVALRGAELTRELLAIGRRQFLPSEVLSVGRTVAGLAGMLRRTIPESIELVVETRPGVRVEMARTQLEQVVLNLVLNAVDAIGGEPGRIAVDVRAARLVEPRGRVPAGAWARIEVSDTGCGIRPEALPRIFEPFFTTKSEERGSGLGLAALHGIVTQRGGVITVDSAPGEGTTFAVYLPLVDDGEPDSSSVDPVPGPAVEIPDTPGRRVVLVVEDDPMVRRSLVRLVERAGLGVVARASPAEAWAWIEADPDRRVDLLVSDVVMPGELRAVDLYDRLRRRGLRGAVFVSGYAPDLDEVRRVVATGARFLSKPVEPAAFHRELTELAEQAPAR